MARKLTARFGDRLITSGEWNTYIRDRYAIAYRWNKPVKVKHKFTRYVWADKYVWPDKWADG